MNITYISPELGFDILSVKSCKEQVVVLGRNGVLCSLYGGRLSKSQSIETETTEFVDMNIFGDKLVILFQRLILIHDLPSLNRVSSLVLKCEFNATCFAHPITYMNKVIVGFENGIIQLLNINSKKLIYTFKNCIFSSSITCIESSPVADVVAVALEDGSVWICDVRKDLKLFCLKHSSHVTCMCFGNESQGSSHFIAGLSSGQIALWDLEGRTLIDLFRGHIGGPVVSLQSIQGQCVFVTSGYDNSLKEWIIDSGASVRLLRSRSGHSSSPHILKFYDGGNALISAADDKSLRFTSLIKDSQSVELSQGSIEAKARRIDIDESLIKYDPVISLDVFVTKDMKWDNLITAQKNSEIAHTWRVDHRRVGTHEFISTDKSPISCVSMSSCGNFSILGCVSGAVDIFNIQSGIHRRHFEPTSPSSVISIGLDAANTYFVSVHANGSICCRELHNGKIRLEANAPNVVTKAVFHNDSELLALALQDFSIVVFDIKSQQLVRHFAGHEDSISDLVFTADTRWIISSSKDLSIRTWDIPTGVQIDTFRCPFIPKAIAMSPAMKFLAVSFENVFGIYLYTNLSLYRPVAFEKLHNAISLDRLTLDEEDDEISCCLTRLSLESRSKFKTVYHLNDTKEKSKPVLAPRAAEKSPFFLDSFIKKRNTTGDRVQQDERSESSIRDKEFLQLFNTDSAEQTLKIFDYLRQMSASQSDFELRSFTCPLQEDEQIRLEKIIEALMSQIEHCRNYELALVFLNVLLESNLAVFLENSKIFTAILAKIRDSSHYRVNEITNLFHQVLALSSFCRDH